MMSRALLVIDVQNEYVSGRLPIAYPPVEESLAAIGEAMDAAAGRGIPIVVVQQTAPETAEIFARGSVGFELHPTVGTRPFDHLVEKAQPSAFVGTDLAEWLAARDIDTVVIVGWMTQNCDDSTARDAAQRGLKVEFLADATGTLDFANEAGRASARQLHETTLIVLQSRFAAVATTTDWIAALDSGLDLPRSSIFSSTR